MEKPEVQDPRAVARELLANVPPPDVPESAPAPAPSAEIGAAGSPPPPAADTSAAQPRDDGGHVFRPGFHRLDSTGAPFKNRRGFFMPRGGRKPGSVSRPPVSTPPASATPWSAEEKSAAAAAPPPPISTESPSTAPPPPPVSGSENHDHSDDAAEVFCLVLYTLTGFVFDAPEDCQPKPAEHDNMKRASAAYVRSKGWKSSPGIGILLMAFAYVLRVVRKPVPAAKVKKWMDEWRAGRAKPVQKTEPAKTATPTGPGQPQRTAIITTLDNLSERSA